MREEDVLRRLRRALPHGRAETASQIQRRTGLQRRDLEALADAGRVERLEAVDPIWLDRTVTKYRLVEGA